MNKIFEIKNISVGYSKKHQIIDNLDLEINEGEFVSIIGPNGSGKSTLLKAITKIQHFRNGFIKYDNKFINKTFKMWFFYKLGHLLKLPINEYYYDPDVNFVDDVNSKKLDKTNVKNHYYLSLIWKIAKENNFNENDELLNKNFIYEKIKINKLDNQNDLEINYLKKILLNKFYKISKKRRIFYSTSYTFSKDNKWFVNEINTNKIIFKKIKILNFFAKLLRVKNNELIFSFTKPYYDAIEYSRNVSLVPQIVNFPQDVTVFEFVSMGRYPHLKMVNNSKNIDLEKVNQAIDSVNLSEFKDQYVDQLSGGQKQRALIALSLAQDTKTILLDEPTNHLDIKHQLEIIELLHELNHKYQKTIILVIHDINQGIKYSNKLVIMKDGKIVFNGNTHKELTADIIKDVFNVNVSMDLTKEKRNITKFWIE